MDDGFIISPYNIERKIYRENNPLWSKVQKNKPSVDTGKG